MQDLERFLVDDQVSMADDVDVGFFSVLGSGSQLSDRETTVIEEGTEIGSHVKVYQGAYVGEDCLIDDYARVGYDVDVGRDSKILPYAMVDNKASLAENTVVRGFIGERVEVGENSRVFGNIVHLHDEPHLPWYENDEPAPSVGRNVVVGFGAGVAGDIEIGDRSYVGMNAVVTRDVPEETIVIGNNDQYALDEWKGELSSSDFFEQ